MPRPDYEKLKKLFHQGNIGDNTYLLASDRLPFLKMFDLNTRFVASSDADIYQYQYLWIDIFPVDGFPSSEEESQHIVDQFQFYRKLLEYSRKKIFNGRTFGEKIVNFIKKAVTFKLLWCLLTQLIGAQRIADWIDRKAQKYSYVQSEYVGCVSFGLSGMGERIPKTGAESFCELVFEGRKMPAFSCWDSYLKGLFGDYMVLPPEAERVSHSLKGYIKE